MSTRGRATYPALTAILRKEVSRAAEKFGYAALDWDDAEEQVVEHADANEYRFDRDGRMLS